MDLGSNKDVLDHDINVQQIKDEDLKFLNQEAMNQINFSARKKFDDERQRSAEEKPSIYCTEKDTGIKTESDAMLNFYTTHFEVEDMDLTPIKHEVDHNINELWYKARKSIFGNDEKLFHTNVSSTIICNEEMYSQALNLPLIVQCPGCLAEFRGLSYRFSHLRRHIKRVHSDHEVRFMALVQARYLTGM